MPQRTSRLQRLAAAGASIVLVVPAATSAQEPLQLNVPYHCEDGITRIITRCASNARGEVCFWREEKDGQLIVERYNVRGQMDGWLKTCQPPPSARPADQAHGPPPQALPAGAAVRSSGPLDPAYLAGFPDVDRVKREIRGADPVDTLARQVAALNYLPRIIRRMQMVPGRPYDSSTPDEQRLMHSYAAVSYELSQAYAKSVSPDAAQAFQQAIGRYELDDALVERVYALLTPETMAEFRRANGAANAQAQARIDRIRRENEQARTAPAAAGAGGTPVRNDPGTLAARRCLELGGGELECMGKGLSTGWSDFTGIDLSKLTSPAPPAGLRVGGTFKTSAGLTLAFARETVTLAGCGQLVEDTRSYSLAPRGAQLEISISNESRPLVVVLGADGRITGPAPFDVNGQVIVGYQKYWVVERRASDNSVVEGSGHEVATPIYGPKTERCSFASLRATAPVQAEQSLIGTIAGAASGQADPASERSGTLEAPAGPRMAGKYAGNGLQLDFRPTAVVIDCGEAHVLRPYAVGLLPDHIAVTLRNGNVPVGLALNADGTLSGSGSIDVAGRVVTGVDANGPTFAPRTARCAVGSMTPQ